VLTPKVRRINAVSGGQTARRAGPEDTQTFWGVLARQAGIPMPTRTVAPPPRRVGDPVMPPSPMFPHSTTVTDDDIPF